MLDEHRGGRSGAMHDDLAPKAYWEDVWRREAPADPIDPEDRRPGNHLNRQFDTLFREMLDGIPEGARLIEVGCARSQWLPYFARRFGLAVHGIDYTERGCEQARDILRGAGVDGTVVDADVFSPPAEMIGAFDVVVSFGLVEHFRDTAAVTAQLAALAAPGGRVITVIPNMYGVPGLVTRTLNRDVYDMHVPLDPSELAAAHRAVGLEVADTRWFGASNFAVVNLQGIPTGTRGLRVKQLAHSSLVRLSQVIWTVELAGVRVPSTRRWSPYVVCLATKPPQASA